MKLGFWHGFLSAFGLAGPVELPELGGLEDDWKRVGQDLQRAIDSVTVVVANEVASNKGDDDNGDASEDHR